MSGRKRLKGRSHSTTSVLKGLREVEVDASILKNICNNGLCTAVATSDKKNAFMQTVFNCLDCRLSNVCETCVARCHEHHMITPFFGEKKKVYCDCGVHFKCLAMTTISSKLRDESNRPDILSAIHGQVNAIWQSPLAELTIGQDLPRLGLKHEVRLHDVVIFNHTFFLAQKAVNQVGHSSSEEEAEVALIESEYHSDFIEGLIKLLFEKLDQRNFDSLWRRVVMGNLKEFEFPQLCNKFFAELGNNHVVTKAIISPMWLYLKKVLLPKECVSFNDAKGGWFVSINVTPTNKQEVSQVKNPANQPKFTFSWQLQMIFDLALTTLQSVNFAVTSLEADELIDLETESELQANLRPWIQEPFLEQVKIARVAEGRKDISKIYLGLENIPFPSPKGRQFLTNTNNENEETEITGQPQPPPMHPTRNRTDSVGEGSAAKKLPKPPQHLHTSSAAVLESTPKSSTSSSASDTNITNHTNSNSNSPLPPPTPHRSLPIREASRERAATVDGEYKKPLPELGTHAKFKRTSQSGGNLGNNTTNAGNNKERAFHTELLASVEGRKIQLQHDKPLPRPTFLTSSNSQERLAVSVKK